VRLTRGPLVLALWWVGCRGTEVVAPSVGSVRVDVAMTGVDVDRDGVVVTLDDSIAVAVPSNGSYQFSDVVAGSHRVTLGGATANCTSVGALTRTIIVAPSTLAVVGFPLTCTATTLAPSGVIAFARADADHTYDLWLMNADGTGQIRVRDAPGANDFLPSWTPDGTHLVFVTTSQIAVIALDGTGFTPLTPGGVTAYTPSVSHDGTRIAYSQQNSGSDYDIWVMNIDGTNQHRITTDPAYEDHPTWSPDGTRIAFARNYAIYVMDADGGNVRRLSPAGTTNDNGPAWSPDGTRIAFHSGAGVPAHIYTVKPDGSALTPLTSGLDNDYFPTWSTDGSRIAFGSGRGSVGGIWSMRADGSDLRRLSSGGFDIYAAWSP